jgi:hypothetical protein
MLRSIGSKSNGVKVRIVEDLLKVWQKKESTTVAIFEIGRYSGLEKYRDS